ncbi:MAG: cobalt ECF transporter T component CbiQ [Methanomassiliicoccaceae archaeon]|nr:cobalt ECF transporter T component CbiQ [Euryarchaeota archaeon]HOB37969.1 cobalt ECF transporter T component CbiQ [Methanomassiliicoccaceae archaeon]HOL08171.1 cobalt ECF transporter T component CbiQ [Methanomassiliicoccaceae archaeon]HOQ25464.1 cobalt ECF transporter T component CbiQ [Methanomassiliicoccaceae archaeon]HQA21867.1 cobalt ECF transporter T component CbiQ [Methanomassiliicoccaceae archaeon]
MRHYEIDRYSRTSTLFGFDPRVKLACVVSLVVVTALLRSLEAVVIVLAFSIILLLSSRVPLRHVWKGLAIALPFIIAPPIALFLTSGPIPALTMAFRILASVLILTAMVTTTPLFDVIKTLSWYRMPRLLISLIMFTYRFIFVLLDEMERMKMARIARGHTGRGSLLSREVFRTLSYTIGMIFVRSHKRAVNMYDALLSRGYTGEVRTGEWMKVKGRDAALAAIFFLVGSLSVLTQVGLINWTLLV